MPSPHGLIAARHGRVAVAAEGLRGGLRQALRGSAEAMRRRPLGAAPLQGMLRERRAMLDGLAARLESVSPMRVLARGYVLVRDEADHAVTASMPLASGQRLRLVFADGEREVGVL